jgi:hypothetical protein
MSGGMNVAGALVALIGAFIGIPIGVVAGRTVWRNTATGVNAVPDLWRWPADAAAVAAATVVVAGLVVIGCTTIPGRRPSTRQSEQRALGDSVAGTTPRHRLAPSPFPPMWY